MGLVFLVWWLFVPNWQKWSQIPPGYALLIVVFWPLILGKRFERQTLATVYGTGLGVVFCGLYGVSVWQSNPLAKYLEDCPRDEVRVMYHYQRASVNLTSGIIDRTEPGRAVQEASATAQWKDVSELKALLDSLPAPSWKLPGTDPFTSGHFSVAFYRYGFLHIYHYADNEAVEQKQELMKLWAR